MASLALPVPAHAVHADGVELLGERDRSGILAGELAHVLHGREGGEGQAGVDLAPGTVIGSMRAAQLTWDPL